jgi:hypothetical protein
MAASRPSFDVVGTLFGSVLMLTGTLAPLERAAAQEGPLEPGEAYVTRFSGTQTGPGGPVIDLDGTVGGIIDVRAPGQAPQGTHWLYEPQRSPVTAGQVGQVFGVTLDDANPPNVYLTATSAFGLHRTPNNAQWMPGMWGQGGGPGTIYRLDAANGYQPRPFAQVSLNGRPNSGPALGNIAYDRFNKQLFVSDLETGMIHRIRASDGADLGYHDHGVQGRANFLDAETGQQGSLDQIGFDPDSNAIIGNCQGRFDLTPQCWNFAYSGRRVWGLGVHRNPSRNEVRLYYSVWSGPAFGNDGWQSANEDDKRNSVWSVRLGPDGNFAGDVRREFILPDFFVKPEDIARAGYSQPVSDISFATCGPRPVMLLAERGGIRNLGLSQDNPFATPHEARALRYELDESGTWRAVGRYDVGFYSRDKEGQPFINANCSGGIAFGLGYDSNTWMANQSKVDQFVWITGDALCSPEGPCNLPGQAQPGSRPQPVQGGESPLDDSQVHGIQGMSEAVFEEIAPNAARQQPSQSNAAGSAGLAQSYLIDTDINFDAQGGVIDAELARNDATKIGDIAIYQPCEGPTDYTGYFLLPGTEPPPPAGHHYRYGSHSAHWSHNRFGSHNPNWSHNRFESHDRYASHWRYGSHDRRLSHQRNGSHDRNRSHWRDASHDQRASHNRTGSHDQRLSHARTGSHNQRLSHSQQGSHNQVQSHNQKGSHNTRLSHAQQGSHNQAQSHNQKGSHNTRLSHAQKGSHNQAQSHNQKGSHNTRLSHAQKGSHNQAQSHNQKGSHNTRLSHAQKGSHNQAQSHSQKGSHNTRLSHAQKGSHNQAQSHNQKGSHNTRLSHAQKGSHNQAQSHSQKGSHNTHLSSAQKGSHNQAQSHSRTGSHNPRQSHSQKGSHSTAASRQVPR